MAPVPADGQRVMRRELGGFLRAHRERLPPAEAGLRAGPRRRTPGLRREEVATLAGVSVSWYTWLEQGRVGASRQVLASLAGALRFDEHATAHLLTLAGYGGTVAEPPRDDGSERAVARLRPLLDQFAETPAMLLDGHLDVLAWNDAYLRTWPDPAAVGPARRNLMWMTVADRRVRELVEDWDSYARAVLAQFNAQIRKRPGAARAEEILSLLRTEVPELADWWECRAVAPLAGHTLGVRDGPRTRYFTAHAMSPADAPGTLVVAHVPTGPATA